MYAKRKLNDKKKQEHFHELRSSLQQIPTYISLNNVSLLWNQLQSIIVWWKIHILPYFSQHCNIWSWKWWQKCDDLLHHPHTIFHHNSTFLLLLFSSFTNLDRYFHILFPPSFHFIHTLHFHILKIPSKKTDGEENSEMKWEWISLLNVPFSLSILLTRYGRK